MTFLKNTALATSAAAALMLAAPAAFAACPDWLQNGQTLGYSSDDLWSPKSHTVVAGGENDLADCAEMPGFGEVATAPISP